MNGTESSTSSFSEPERLSLSQRWKQAIKDADEMLSKSDSNTTTPSCLIPNTHATMELVEKQLLVQQQQQQPQQASTSNLKAILQPPSLVPLPIMNLGMPKTGSTTLSEFLTCAGLNGTHQHLGNNKNRVIFEGVCMRDAVNVGLPPIATCASDQQFMMQMDVEFPMGFGTPDGSADIHRDECYFPQIELLEEFHNEVPESTFIMNFRPIEHWIKSMNEWDDMLNRFKGCDFPTMPRGLPQSITNVTETTIVLKRFLCSHVLHIRQFVQDHPSHKLIELDLYDTDISSYVMTTLFPNSQTKDQSCWHHANQSPSKGAKTGNRR